MHCTSQDGRDGEAGRPLAMDWERVPPKLHGEASPPGGGPLGVLPHESGALRWD